MQRKRARRGSGRRLKVKEEVKHPFVEAEGEGEGKDSGGWREGRRTEVKREWMNAERERIVRMNREVVGQGKRFK